MRDRRLPPLYPLRAFEAVARRLSFTLAADELSISQSAVSHQVKSLEAYFGVSLFYRSPNSLRLTAEGKRLFSACEAAFGHLAQIRDYLPESEMRGTLTLSSPPLIFNWWLLPRLSEFSRQYPNIRFGFLHMICGDRVLASDTDLAIFWDEKTADGFIGAKMFDMGYSVVTSPRLAATLPEEFSPEVLDRTVLLHENDHVLWTSWARQAGFPDLSTTSGWVFEDPGMMIEAATAGQGLALAPFPLLDELVNCGRLVKIFGHSVSGPNNYILSVSNRSMEKPAVALFWNWFTKYGLPKFSVLAEGSRTN